METRSNNRNVVWEHRTEGTRFMTPYRKGGTYKDSEHHILIGENLEYEDALALCTVTEDKNIASFLDDLPAELRDPETDAFIANLIKDGGRGAI